MISFALRSGGAFTGKSVINRCLRQATKIPRNHWISTTNNARLWYLEPLQLYQKEKPYHINLPASALRDHAQSNEVSRECAGIRIENLRGFENDFNLDEHGFQVFQDIHWGYHSEWSTNSVGATPISRFYNDPDAVRNYYYPAIENLLKEKLRAQSAKAFTHDVGLPYDFWKMNTHGNGLDASIGSSKRAAIPSSTSRHRKCTSTSTGSTCRQAAFSSFFYDVIDVDSQTLLLDGRKRSFVCFFPQRKRGNSCSIGGKF